jgi:hypothetical protein
MQVLSIKRIGFLTIALSLILLISHVKKEGHETPAVTEAEATEYSTESMEAEPASTICRM